jgi:hypothetical protein
MNNNIRPAKSFLSEIGGTAAKGTGKKKKNLVSSVRQ